MFHYHEAIANTKGDVLTGYYVKAINTVTLDVADIYADQSATPIVSVSLVANAALVDSDGNASFYIQGGTYHLDIYGTDATTFIRRIPNIPMVDLTVDAGTVQTRAEMAALSPAPGDLINLSEAGREGTFVFVNDNFGDEITADQPQGIYIPPASDPSGESGAWVRSFSGPLDIRWFGAVANDPGTGGFGTDDYPAFAAAKAVAEVNAIAGYVNGTIYRGGASILIPKGGYYFSQSMAPLFTGIIRGEGGKGWGAATRIRFASGKDGLQLQAHNTSGKTTFDGVTHFAGDRIHVCDIAFIGAYSGTESDTHGVRGKRAGSIERCTFDGFEGDGLYCNTTFGSGVGSTEGNTNAMRVIDCDFQNNRRGRYCEGNDANAIVFIGCSYINNRITGIDEEGFLGNHEFGPHIDGNARTANNTGTASKPASYTSIGGYRYFVIRGNETGAATNAPKSSTVTITIASPGVVTWNSHGLANGTQVALSTTGALPTGLSQNTAYYVVNAASNTFQLSATYGGSAINTTGSQSGVHTAGAGVDNTWWGYWEAGAPDATTGIPAYAGSMTWRPGGPVLHEGASNSATIAGCHIESNGISQIDQGMLMQGTVFQVVRVTSGTLFRDRSSTLLSSSEGLVIGGNVAIRGDIRGGSATGNILGPYKGATVQDGVTSFATHNLQHTFEFKPYDSVGVPGTTWLSVPTGSGFGRSNDFVAGLFDRWKFNSVEMLKVDSTGLQIGTGTALSKAVVYTPSITPSSVSAATVAEQTFTVSGLTTADKVTVNPPSIGNATGIAGARVSAADTLAIRFVNPTAGALTPTSGTYTVLAFRS